MLLLMITASAAVAADDGGQNAVWHSAAQPACYSVTKGADPVVQTAIGLWTDDLHQVTGARPVAVRKRGTIRIVQLNRERRATHGELRRLGVPVDSLAGPADGFFIKAFDDGRLLVVGSNGRGTAYGILELSRRAGVSPWTWWCDAVPERREQLTLPVGFQTLQVASVAFRGIFINDEDWSLRPWSSKTYEPAPDGQSKGRIGAKTYRRVFELLMRLRANAIWPAMHEQTTPFYMVPGAKEQADSCGIVVGTSHCEPMMRNNAGEWNRSERGAYNYITNKSGVQQYWTERLSEVNRYDNIYTVGMRGIHDGPMEGVGKSLDEKTTALQQVIDDQRELLRQYVNANVEQVPQQFVPYKEVLEVLENGLRVPEDVTLTWCDDNYGYMTRLADADQQRRSGGSGVYYHLSYWGRPHDYLWLSSTQPGLIYNEMREAYDHNARRLWIANVHDVKTAAYDLELFLDMAWNIGAVKSNTLWQHQRQWLCREFGRDAGERLLPVMREFYRLTNIRKPEFMGWTQVELDKKKYARGWSPVVDTEFSLTAFGGELDRYLNDWRRTTDALQQIEVSLPDRLRDAFFSHVKYPVLSAAAMSRKMLEAQRARAIAKTHADNDEAQPDTALLTACAKSQDAYQEILRLTDDYNNRLAGGKWKHLITSHPRDLYVFAAPNLPDTLTDAEVSTYRNLADGLPAPIADDGRFVARNACQWDEADGGAECVQSLGRSMNAVRLPKGQTLTYKFDARHDGEALLRVALIPTQPNDRGDLRFAVSIDGGEPQVFSLKEPFRSERWKQNVLRGQAVREMPVLLKKGGHQLGIKALDNHIVVDQWMIDYDVERRFYVFPVAPSY